MVVLVAGLPIACGSTSPTGPDIAALDAGATASALRSAPGLPPTAPEAPSPDSVPAPAPSNPNDDAGSVPAPGADTGTVPAPGADTDSVPAPSADTDSVPAPGADTGSRPGNGPATDPPGTDPLPADTGSVPTPPPADTDSVPAPPPADTDSVPAPPVRPVPAPNAPPVVVPPPPQPGDDGARECLAAAAEIRILRGSLPLPLGADSVLLEVVMLGKDGNPIRDNSCQGVAWSVDGTGTSVVAAAITITVGADTRFATVDGLAGAYVIRATTPNGQTATVVITLP